ncbi:Uncharacterised protein [Paucimonas lemoignei]|nr:Uncharacterised protein [Paucimonas lemoignei]
MPLWNLKRQPEWNAVEIRATLTAKHANTIRPTPRSPTVGVPTSRSKYGTCGSELARERAGTFNRDASAVRPHSRASSLPQVIRRVGIVELTREAALAAKVSECDLPDTPQPNSGSQFIREGAGTFSRYASLVHPSSRMNSLPQFIRRLRMHAPNRRALAVKSSECDLPDTTQHNGGSEFIREEAGTFNRYPSSVQPPSDLCPFRPGMGP